MNSSMNIQRTTLKIQLYKKRSCYFLTVKVTVQYKKVKEMLVHEGCLKTGSIPLPRWSINTMFKTFFTKQMKMMKK